MANIKIRDKETYDQLGRCWSLPVCPGRWGLQNWFSNMLSSWGWDSECRIERDPDQDNWFSWAVFDRDGNRLVVGGLIYRDNGWESHT